MKNFHKQFGNCDSVSNYCASISVDYPEFTQAKNEMILDSLNGIVKRLTLQPVFETKTGSLEELSDYLINDYKKVKKEFPDSPIQYELERKVNILLNQSGILSLEYIEYSFLGGAHPNGVRTFLNLNTETGKEISLDELLVKGYEKKLNSIGEKNFRVVRNLKGDDELEKNGFWFKDNKFALNKNFLITRSGLTFYFNDYEIAPHVMSPTEVIIKFDDLKDLIDRDGLLRGIME